jgi:glycosyltransferase involved in cell wall biosynthesis
MIARADAPALAHVAIVTDESFVNGGIARVALSSAVALAEAGYEVSLFTAVGPIDPGLLGRQNLRVLCTGQRDILSDPNRAAAAVRGLWNRRAARMFDAHLSELDRTRTVVHVHCWTKALSSSVVRTALRRRFPTVVTLHEYFTACPNGGFFNHRSQQICSLEPLGPRCILADCDARSYAHKAWRVGRQVVQHAAGGVPSRIKHFISVSDFSRERLRPYLPLDAAFYAIPNPIDVRKEPPVDVARNGEFVFVGRLSKEKGASLFADAANRLGVDAVFVGDGECKEDVRARNPRATITGWLAPHAVNARLSRARALVFPSVWYETFGLVVLEAAARGVPAIVSDRTCASELIVENETGLLFRAGDAGDLARKIEILRDPGAAAAMGAEAYRRYWSSPLLMENHLERLVHVYGRVLQGG